jgi:tetratricopeptide (TPR) repeat protein
MLHHKNSIALILLLWLQGCAAVGYLESNDPKTVILQGFDLEKMNRVIAAEGRYKKGLNLAEANGDARMIAYAKHSLGMFYRNPNAYDAKKSIYYLKESLKFYGKDTTLGPIALSNYTALTEVYSKEGDRKSACLYLKKAQQTYIKKILPNPDFNKPGKGYEHFFNPVRREHPFKKFDELVDYYNQQLACGL